MHKKILVNKQKTESECSILNTEIYLSLPIYVLLDLEMLSASIEITYSVHVVLRVRFAERRNFPFSTSKAAGITYRIKKAMTVIFRESKCVDRTFEL